MSTMTDLKSMLLVKGTFSHEGVRKATFKMIPISNDCPYMEAMYHTVYRGLGIIGKFKKNVYEMVPAVDKNGSLMPKKKKLEAGEYPFIQERRQVENWNEYEILTKDEIIQFVEMFAVNNDTFDYKQFLKEDSPQVTEMKATVTEDKVEA